MATFGKTDDGPHGNLVAGRIRGSLYTCLEAGTPTNISCRLARFEGVSRLVQCCGYLHSDSSLKFYTEEVNVNLDGPLWWDFPIEWQIGLAAGDYVVCLWSNGNIEFYYEDGAVNQRHSKVTAYVDDGFPDPIAFDDMGTEAIDIHVDYTPSGGVVKKGSNLANTMTTMLNSKMLFSQCNRFPKLCPRQF